MKLAPVILAYLCLFSLGYLDNSRGPLYPQILKTFGISTLAGSFLFSGSAFSAFIVAMFSEKIIKKFSLIRPSQFGLICYVISSFLLSYAPVNDFGLYAVILASAILGIGVGIHSVTLNLIINENVPTSLKRRLFSGLHSMYGIASFLAPISVGQSLRYNSNWQIYFKFLGIGLSAICVLSFFIRKEKINKHLDHKEFKIETPIWPMALMFSCYVCAEVILSSRMVLFLTDHFSLDHVKASEYLSLFFICLLAGRLSFAFLPIKLSSKSLLVFSALLSLIFCLIGIFYEPLFLGLTGLSMSYFFPCGMDFVAGYFTERELDVAFSKVMIAVGGALVLLHFSFGQLTNYLGVSKSILLIPLLIIIVLYILQVQLPFLAKQRKSVS